VRRGLAQVQTLPSPGPGFIGEGHVVHNAPLRRAPGIEARVYSGASGAVHAPSHTYLPMTMVDVQLMAGVRRRRHDRSSHCRTRRDSGDAVCRRASGRDLVRLSQTYLRGEMPPVSELTSTPSR